MELNQLFCDGLILQANKPVRVFGTGTGTATVAIGGKTATVQASGETWLAELPTFDYGGPYILEVDMNGETQTVRDVYFGDVYLLSGQSNMQMKLDETNTPTSYYASNPDLRLFSTDRVFEDEDYFHTRDGWVKADEKTVAHWSALGYLSAKILNEKTGRKIGLIACYQGAAMIQSWLPKGILLGTDCAEAAEENSLDMRNPDYLAWNMDGNLYSAQFATLLPFSLKAVLWYQGESNTCLPGAPLYRGMLEMLIRRWRKDLLDEKLDFVVMQLANLFVPFIDQECWQTVQTAQERISQEMENVHTVKCADFSETDNIHPVTKLPLAERIAAVLLTV